MKKTIIITLFLLFQIIVRGQIKKDTVYLYFNHKKNQSFKLISKRNNEPFKYYYTYHFNDSLNNKILVPILTNDSLDFNQKANIKWVDKKFIKKNKDQIYCIKKMQEKGYQNVINEIHNCVIYLIDTKIKKSGKYKAREVNINFLEEM